MPPRDFDERLWKLHVDTLQQMEVLIHAQERKLIEIETRLGMASKMGAGAMGFIAGLIPAGLGFLVDHLMKK